jgi:hypothetical protein
MNITRVERDGVEFFTINATGESGMSESGLARLCGVARQTVSELLQNWIAGKTCPECLKPLIDKDFGSQARITGKTPSECLKPFADKDFRSQAKLQAQGLNHVTVVKAEVCAAVIEYYAFESRYKTKEALFAFRKFATMGIQSWIQEITGWHQSAPEPEQKVSSRRVVRSQISASRNDRPKPSQLAPQIKPPDAIELDLATIDLLTREIAQGSTFRLYLQLLKFDAMEQRPPVADIAEASNIKRSVFYTSLKQLRQLGLYPDWLEPRPHNGIEKSIRDRLHQTLGGRVEAPTKFGPVDLLTPTELIEVKELPDWKTGLGQLLAKTKCYSDRAKRLHLYGRSSHNLDNIRACCAEFDIAVTFESI